MVIKKMNWIEYKEHLIKIGVEPNEAQDIATRTIQKRDGRVVKEESNKNLQEVKENEEKSKRPKTE